MFEQHAIVITALRIRWLITYKVLKYIDFAENKFAPAYLLCEFYIFDSVTITFRLWNVCFRPNIVCHVNWCLKKNLGNGSSKNRVFYFFCISLPRRRLRLLFEKATSLSVFRYILEDFLDHSLCCFRIETLKISNKSVKMNTKKNLVIWKNFLLKILWKFPGILQIDFNFSFQYLFPLLTFQIWYVVSIFSWKKYWKLMCLYQQTVTERLIETNSNFYYHYYKVEYA